MHMGGFGSGRPGGWARKRAVEDCYTLDVNALHRQGALSPAMRSVQFSVITDEDGAQVVTDGHLAIVRVPCRYGGARPYFLCPHCGRRVAKLYAPAHRFLCRRCHDLAYRCQRENAAFRAKRRGAKIRRRLGGSGAPLSPLPPKPKGMQWETYDRLVMAVVREDSRVMDSL